MTTEKSTNGLGSRVLWAILSPVILLAAGLSIVGIVLIPAVCVYLDKRSGTYTAAISMATICAVLSALYGMAAMGFCIFLLIATAAVYYCIRAKMPFKISLLISAGGGVLGFLFALAIINFSLNTSISIAASDWFFNQASRWPQGTLLSPLDLMVLSVQMSKGAAQLFNDYFTLANKLPTMPNADKIAMIRDNVETAMTMAIPAFALVAGSLTGALGYYFGRLAIRRYKKRSGTLASETVPAFASFRVPKYIVISLFLLQLLAILGVSAEWAYFEPLYVAVNWLLNMLMVAQALAVASYYLNRKRVTAVVQAVILIPLTIIGSSLMVFVGLIDVLFDLRAISVRMDTLKSSGKQVFTRDSLGRLRRMDQKDSKDRKDDGEEPKK
jgi:uncharacterized protein YybS (DUF2232 family)